jgi:hypothetical protein
MEMTACAKAVQPLDDLIAYCKDLHSAVLCPRTSFPAREMKLEGRFFSEIRRW